MSRKDQLNTAHQATLAPPGQVVTCFQTWLSKISDPVINSNASFGILETFTVNVSAITVKPQVAMDQDELALLKMISLCREDHSLHHPGLGGRKEVTVVSNYRFYQVGLIWH